MITTTLPEPNEVNASSSSRTETQPFRWSVRRELWENHSIYLAPLVVSGFIMLGFAISAIGLPERRRALLLLDPVKQRALVEQPYDVAALILMLTAFLVGIFYCLDALHGERRDRSILFWKSLPVSDLAAVLAKFCIPVVILPLITFVIIELTQLFILLFSTAILAPVGLGATTWERLPLFQFTTILLYSFVTSALWEAPVYGWLLLVSACARRATFLWAILPWLAICIVEKVAFNSAHFAHLLQHRLFGSPDVAFVITPQQHDAVVPMVDRLSQLTPGRFLGTPGLWLGLLAAALFLAATVQLRRSRGPL